MGKGDKKKELTSGHGMGYNTWELQTLQGQEMRWQISSIGNSAYGLWRYLCTNDSYGTEAFKNFEQVTIIVKTHFRKIYLAAVYKWLRWGDTEGREST